MPLKVSTVKIAVRKEIMMKNTDKDKQVSGGRRKAGRAKNFAKALISLLLALSLVLSGCTPLSGLAGYGLGQLLSGKSSGHFEISGNLNGETFHYDSREDETSEEDSSGDAEKQDENTDGKQQEEEEDEKASAKEEKTGTSLVLSFGDEESTPEFLEFTEELFGEYLSGNTVNIHFFTADPARYGLEEEEVSWGSFDVSEEALAEYEDWLSDTKKKLRAFDYDALTTEEQMIYDCILESLEDEEGALGLELYYEPLSSTSGEQVYAPVYLSIYAFDSEADVEDYLALLKALPEYFEEILAFEEKKAEAGLFMSDALLSATIEQCEDFIAGQEESFLYVTFDEKIEEMDLSDAKKEEYKKKNREYVDTYIYPAYEMLAESLAEFYGSGTLEGGLSATPEGRQYYAYLVKSSTGSSKTLAEISALLDEKLAECLETVLQMYRRDPYIFDEYDSIIYPGTDPSLCMRILIEETKADFPDLSEVDYTIQYTDESLRDYLSPAFYFLPQVDSQTTDHIFINTDKGDEDENIFITMAHEGYPGHLYQTNYLKENSDYVLRQLISTNGFAEGWAEYVELLSYKYIDGVDESLQRFAAAYDELVLLIYARCDIGVHYENWGTAEIEELWEQYFEADDEAAEWIYEYVLGDPGTYLDYALGLLEIQELYDTAVNEAGATLKEFHTALLNVSGAPFDIARKYMFE